MNAPSVQFSIPMKSTGVAYLLWLFFGGFGALGGLGVTGIAMIAPLPIAFLYDLFTIPSQVRAANNRLISESSNYFGSGSKSGAAFDNDELDSEKLAQIDQTIARYKAQQSTAVSTPGRTPAPTSGAPTFGKRR